MSYIVAEELVKKYGKGEATVTAVSEISFQMNKVMQVLTVITTIFVPLSFLAGLYGMNFDHMPELHWRYGYFGLLAVMFIVMMSLLFWFRRNRWL